MKLKDPIVLTDELKTEKFRNEKLHKKCNKLLKPPLITSSPLSHRYCKLLILRDKFLESCSIPIPLG